jgi:hypothetical protein
MQSQPFRADSAKITTKNARFDNAVAGVFNVYLQAIK